MGWKNGCAYLWIVPKTLNILYNHLMLVHVEDYPNQLWFGSDVPEPLNFICCFKYIVWILDPSLSSWYFVHSLNYLYIYIILWTKKANSSSVSWSPRCCSRFSSLYRWTCSCFLWNWLQVTHSLLDALLLPSKLKFFYPYIKICPW